MDRRTSAGLATVIAIPLIVAVSIACTAVPWVVAREETLHGVPISIIEYGSYRDLPYGGEVLNYVIQGSHRLARQVEDDVPSSSAPPWPLRAGT